MIGMMKHNDRTFRMNSGKTFEEKESCPKRQTHSEDIYILFYYRYLDDKRPEEETTQFYARISPEKHGFESTLGDDC